MENKKPIYPVVRWGISQAPTHQIGLIRLAYFTAPGQTDDQASESPIYGFSPEQLRTLADALNQAADELQAAVPPPGRRN